MRAILTVTLLLGATATCQAQPVPEAVAAPGEQAIMTVHAEGAQVYECKVDQAGRLTWQFREPIATLIQDGRTVGRHYAGPHWEFENGDVVAARVTGRAQSDSTQDIPLLRLEVTTRRGSGPTAATTTVQRLATRGGALEGPCEQTGAFRSIAYSAQYVFLRRPN